MRTTASTAATLLAAIFFASSAIAVPSPMPQPVPIKIDTVDKKVASYDTPKHFHQDCDVHNVQCKAVNQDVYGSANYGEGAVGKQVGHAAHAGSEIAAIEGQTDLSKSLAANGPVLQHDLQGRDHGHSEINEGLKSTSHEVFGSGLLTGAGDFVGKQGAAAESAGKGVNAIGKEANGQTNTVSKGQHKHSAEVINAVIG